MSLTRRSLFAFIAAAPLAPAALLSAQSSPAKALDKARCILTYDESYLVDLPPGDYQISSQAWETEVAYPWGPEDGGVIERLSTHFRSMRAFYGGGSLFGSYNSEADDDG
jgi:hypothetical protein